MELEADLSYVLPAVLFSVNTLLLLTERNAFVRKTGCKKQPDKSRYNVRSFVVNFIPGLGFVYCMTVRYVASVSDENPASFFMAGMRM
jgi:hypothetical protein